MATWPRGPSLVSAPPFPPNPAYNCHPSLVPFQALSDTPLTTWSPWVAFYTSKSHPTLRRRRRTNIVAVPAFMPPPATTTRPIHTPHLRQSKPTKTAGSPAPRPISKHSQLGWLLLGRRCPPGLPLLRALIQKNARAWLSRHLPSQGVGCRRRPGRRRNRNVKLSPPEPGAAGCGPATDGRVRATTGD